MVKWTGNEADHLRMCEAICTVLHILSWHAQEQLHPFTFMNKAVVPSFDRTLRQW